jgi:hypothetical protein
VLIPFGFTVPLRVAVAEETPDAEPVVTSGAEAVVANETVLPVNVVSLTVVRVIRTRNWYVVLPESPVMSLEIESDA